MASHQYSYPKVKSTRNGPSAYERRTEVLRALEREADPAGREKRESESAEREPRRRRPAD